MKSFLLTLLLPIALLAQFNEQTGKAEWLVEDTTISAPFVRHYKDQLVKVKGDLGAEEDPSNKVLAEDQLIVEVGLEGSTPVLKSVKAIDVDRAITEFDSRVISSMNANVVTAMIQRRYKWDEVNKSLIKNYSSDIQTIFELRNNKECRDIFWWSSSSATFALPSSWLVRLDERLGAEVTLSNEEYGYPMGMIGGGPGIVKVGLTHQVAKLYVTVPAKLGKGNLEGGYGVGLSFDDVFYGGGFLLQEVDYSGKYNEMLREKGTYSTVFLKHAGYVYYSLTHDVSKIVPTSTLRWKVGPSVMAYSKGTALKTDTASFDYRPELGLYARIELAYGGGSQESNNRMFEFALQGIVGTHRHFLFSATYNIESWLGIECKIASITPSDSWRRGFTFILQPKFRL